MANKKRWYEIRDIDKNEVLIWSNDRLRAELEEQKRRHEGFSEWFSSPASESARGGRWGDYNQQMRGQKIWEDIQYLESLLHSPGKGYVGGRGPTNNQASKHTYQLKTIGEETSVLKKWFVGLTVFGIFVGGVLWIKDYKESKPQTKTSISRIYDGKIKNSLEGLVLSPWGNYHANGWLVTPDNIAYLDNPKSKYKTIFSLNNLPMSFGTMIDKVSIRDRGKDITIYLRGKENEVIETTNGGKTWKYTTSHRMRNRHRFQPVKLEFLTQDKGRTWKIMK